MDIRQIVDKIPKEADINPVEYTVEDRLDDVNQKYLELIEKAVQIASKEPISGAEVFSETFSVSQGSNTFTRTIVDVPLFRVDFMGEGASRYCRLEEDESRGINTWCCKKGCCWLKFFADEKRIFVEEGRPGTLRVTYARGAVTTFTLSDYNAPTPPSPTWLPEVFRKLLWLDPATVQAEFYKKDRAVGMRNELTRLEVMFENHYRRNAQWNQKIETDSGPNYR